MLIFSSTKLWDSFNALTHAARCYAPPQLRASGTEPRVKAALNVSQLVEAAVGFTIQLAIDAAKLDDDEASRLVRSLTAKLSTWGGEGAARTLVLWTHDMNCVLGELSRAAQRYATPPQVAAGTVKSLVENLLRTLTVAAVAFTTQLAIEEADSDATSLRGLERDLIARLEEPWELGAFTLSVEASYGTTWGPLSDEK